MRVSQLGVTVPTIPGKWHTVENTVHIVAIGINQRAFLEMRFQELIKIYGIYMLQKVKKAVRSKEGVISAGRANSEKSLLFNWPS